MQPQINQMMGQMMNYYMNNQAQSLLSNLETRLKQINPQMYQTYQLARQQNADPKDIFKQITKNYDENTMQKFRQEAKQFGISDEILNQI